MPPRVRKGAVVAPASVEEAQALVFAAWSEDDLQRFVMNTARALGYRAYHTRFSVFSAAGYPDLCLCRPPRLLFAELKREGRKPTVARLSRGATPRLVEGQDAWLRDLLACDVEAYWWMPSDQADIVTILTEGATPQMACVRRLLSLLSA